MTENKNKILGSHIAVLLDLSAMVNKQTGINVKHLNNKILMLSAMIKDPGLIDVISENKEVSKTTLDKLASIGIKVPDLSVLSQLKKDQKKGGMDFSTSNTFNANMTLRKNFTLEEFRSYTNAASHLEIKRDK